MAAPATTPIVTKNQVDGVVEAHTDIIAWLYQSKGPTYDEVCAKMEGAGVKREHAFYGVSALMGLYLIFGSAAQFVCNLIGFAYPAYNSVKAVRTESKSDDTQWLIYWTVFATFSLLDFFAVGIMSWFPIYWLLKAAFLLYLSLPQTQGALYLYVSAVDPLVTQIDALLASRAAAAPAPATKAE